MHFRSPENFVPFDSPFLPQLPAIILYYCEFALHTHTHTHLFPVYNFELSFANTF